MKLSAPLLIGILLVVALLIFFMPSKPSSCQCGSACKCTATKKQSDCKCGPNCKCGQPKTTTSEK